MEEQVWWNKNAAKQYDTFKWWVGDDEAESKKYSAQYCVDRKYTSVADVGCGDATFYSSLIKLNKDIQYVGVDSCDFFIELNTKRNIPVIKSDIRHMPAIADSSFDICFSRHTFEHQLSFDKVLTEMIRVGRKEACHIFFIKPDEKKELIILGTDDYKDLFHNKYCKSDIEYLLSNHSKVKSFYWKDLNEQEVALHVLLREN